MKTKVKNKPANKTSAEHQINRKDAAQNSCIPFCRHSIGEEEIRSVESVLKSEWLTTGPLTRDFENAFAAYVGSKYAVAVNSCTAALHIALLVNKIGIGDEVIVPSFTFAATANVVVNAGAKPVFADIDEASLCIDPESVLKKISSRTKAIILVHYGGSCAQVSKIKKIAKQRSILIIEDAAHALGAKYKGKMVGNLGNATAFSFYATKNLNTIEGGMLTTNSLRIYKQAQVLRLHGLSREAWKRYSKGHSAKYEVLAAGFKYNMTDLQAAIGLAQLKRFPSLQQKREQIVNAYFEGLSGLEGVILPTKNGANNQSAWHLFTLRLVAGKAKMKRDDFIDKLAEEGIGTSIHFLPLHLQPFYRKSYNIKAGLLPVTEKVAKEIVSIPLFPDLKDREIKKVINSVRNLLQ